MSEPEKKGSPWPWFLVPVGAVTLFFVLRECRQHLPPAPDQPTTPAATAPANPETPAPADPMPAVPEEAPAPAPAPQ
jgi:hypothetical protein